MRTITISLLFLALMLSSVALAEEKRQADARIDLQLTEPEATVFLAEMREMLRSIQGIITGIGKEDRELIISSARYSGNRMARNTPASIREKLPESFKALGGPTHLMFEELVIRAEVEEMDMLAEFTGELMEQCLACHAQFRVR